MKKLLNRGRVFVLAGLLLLTAATVTASEPVKPDTATKTTPLKIVSTSMVWNYDSTEVRAAANIAVPSATFSKIKFDNPTGTTVYWLRVEGTVTATGKHIFAYFPLIKNGSWYELDPLAVPPGWTGGPAPAASCNGDCWEIYIDADGDYESRPTGEVCRNVSQTWMVNCQCSGNCQDDCGFQQYPISVTETMYNALKQIHE